MLSTPVLPRDPVSVLSAVNENRGVVRSQGLVDALRGGRTSIGSSGDRAAHHEVCIGHRPRCRMNGRPVFCRGARREVDVTERRNEVCLGVASMVIPLRDWLLLRGRMRAVAHISVLPAMLMDPSSPPESDVGEEKKDVELAEEHDA